MTPSLSPEALAKGLTKAERKALLSAWRFNKIHQRFFERQQPRLRDLELIGPLKHGVITYDKASHITDLGRAVARALMEGKGDE